MAGTLRSRAPARIRRTPSLAPSTRVRSAGMFVGREEERRALDALLDDANGERSAVLVVRGEPGIGKSALLEYATEQAGAMRVLRCVGIEAEHELPFAGMHQLVRPCLDLIDRLPGPQAGALRNALGLGYDPVEDRFLVSLGLLSLLAEACDDGPVLCCVDDAQWLDRPSAEALTFAARRFEAEPIAVLIAVREGELRRFDAPGLPELELGPLGEADARLLLESRLDRAASADVLAMLLDSAQGNPLALLELPGALSADELQGIEPIIGPPRVRGAVEETFRRRVGTLDESTRRLLLLAAADEAGDLPAIERAASDLGLSIAGLDEAEAAGLLRIDGAVTFRHPLVRSVVYGSAPRDERRKAHEALAAALDDPVRRAWHRALVADRPDEGIAAELEGAGAQAAARAAHATASAAFERAAELTENPARRGHRLLSAAQASLDAGRNDAALALVERARPLLDDPMEHAHLHLILATDAGRRGTPTDSYSLLMSGADAVAGIAPRAAAQLIAWSMFSSFQGGWVERVVGDVERRLDELDGGGDVAEFGRLIVRGSAALMAGDAVLAGERFEEALVVGEGFEGTQDRSMPPFVNLLMGDLASTRLMAEEVIAELRVGGSLASLVGMLALFAGAQMLERRMGGADATIAEGLELAGQLGYQNDETGLLALRARLAAMRGDEDECRETAQAAMQRSLVNGIGWATKNAHMALAELELGLGNPQLTIEHLEQLDTSPLPPLMMFEIPDLIDAALRVGDREKAEQALDRFTAWLPVVRAPTVRAMHARCRGMLAADSAEAETLFAEALALHPDDAPPFERARTHLAYGERLRRDRRRIESRTQLRTALDTFEGLGTRLWAERARGELNATGETARKRDVSTIDDLTPQELRIAQLVASGASNREAAAQLFVSPKTIDYHLRKVFLKLGVSSRVELAHMPLGDPVPGAVAR
ncbi:MAG: hypothetical protein C5B48_07495 [Candidatus Rokuibacteriota bacterium]|nr:MAG: hypothetical protein C5B48_07495 [Candidatus Rokubacteria bacterium]